jgi:hypothetical protein
MVAMIDLTTITFRDESHCVPGDDHRSRCMRHGQWHETAFVRTTKVPESVMI